MVAAMCGRRRCCRRGAPAVIAVWVVCALVLGSLRMPVPEELTPDGLVRQPRQRQPIRSLDTAPEDIRANVAAHQRPLQQNVPAITVSSLGGASAPKDLRVFEDWLHRVFHDESAPERIVWTRAGAQPGGDGDTTSWFSYQVVDDRLVIEADGECNGPS